MTHINHVMIKCDSFQQNKDGLTYINQLMYDTSY